jgi:endonuclease/exonuclease/phosphatase family metal-dependent hydrolase
LVLALIILGASCFAETVRVTTWNLEPMPAAGTNDTRIPDAAAALKKLNPDVILLQEVRGWRMCEQLAQALKPAEYSVCICSSFREARTGSLSNQQVAILSRGRAYFSWSEAWRPQREATLPGGVAFAALQLGKQRVGFYSVRARTASIGQLLEQVGSVRGWVTNQVQVFVVAGTLDVGAQDDSVRLLEQAGFGDAFLETPAAERVTVAGNPGQAGATADYIFTQPAGCATKPHILPATVFRHYPVTYDVELDAAVVAAAQARRVAALPAHEPQRSKLEPPGAATATRPTTLTPRQQASNRPLMTVAALVGIVALTALVWILATRRRVLSPATPALRAVGRESGGVIPSSYTVVVGTRSATEPAPADTRAPKPPRPIIHIETPGATQTQTEVLRQRALAAEQRAERATAVIRSGLIPHLSLWLKQKLVQKLIADRAELLGTQQAATLKALRVEERLARIEQQIQQQNSAYQARIEALTRELIDAKEENRELIRARIMQVKAEMEAARDRLLAQTESDGQGGA